MLEEIEISTNERVCFVDITGRIKKLIQQAKVKEGICTVYVPHTTAGITVNEGADPSVVRDILTILDKIVPQIASYTHLEGNSPAHIKSTLVGCSKTLIVHNGEIQLGTWQKVFFCEFDGPRRRSFYVKIINS